METLTRLELIYYAQDLTTDIITQLTIAQDFNPQSTPEGHAEKSFTGFLTASRRLSDMVYAVGQGVGFHMIDPIRPLKSLFYQSIFDHKLTAIGKARISSSTYTSSESKSITQLAVSSLPPNKALIRSCVDQIKTFLFAGQDTTATLIQWICYEMSKASHSPLRAVPWEATSLLLPLPSHPVSIASLQVYPSLHLIHRNPNVWGPDAHLFNPGRWLDDAYLAGLPVGANRPFEHGPRNCIGQELAMLEVWRCLYPLHVGLYSRRSA